MSECMQINVKHRECGDFCNLHSVAIGLLAFSLMEWLSFVVGHHIYFLMTFIKAICGKKRKKVEPVQCCFWNGLKIVLRLFLLNKECFFQGNTIEAESEMRGIQIQKRAKARIKESRKAKFQPKKKKSDTNILKALDGWKMYRSNSWIFLFELRSVILFSSLDFALLLCCCCSCIKINLFS